MSKNLTSVPNIYQKPVRVKPQVWIDRQAG